MNKGSNWKNDGWLENHPGTRYILQPFLPLDSGMRSTGAPDKG